VTTDTPTGADPLETAATLIRDVGEIARRARRYRALVSDLAEPAFDRALALGSEIRRAARTTQPHAAIAAAIAELRELQSRCEAAIAEVKRSRDYEVAVARFRAGAADQVATLAPRIFTGVATSDRRGALFWTLPLGSRRGGPHFLPAEDCAARVRTIVSEGLPGPTTPPELGGDETINPVALSDEHDGSESPIALRFQARDLPTPLCRIEGSSIVLVYVARLKAELVVSCQATVEDEWWRVRPDSYREYLGELEAALVWYEIPMVRERENDGDDR
jgi:hypothetical protein